MMETQKEKRLMEQKDLEKFRWQKLLEKVAFRAPSDDYYDSLPIKPGFMFFPSLFKSPRSPISSLKLTVPDTILFSDRVYQLTTLPSGYLCCSKDPNFLEMLKKIEESKADLSGPLKVAAGIVRGKGEMENCMTKQILDWTMLKQKMAAREVRPNHMIQEFIRSPGGRPAVMRLFYNRSTKDTSASYAYQIVAINSHKYSETELIKRCTVDFSTLGNLEIMKQTGVAIKPLEDAAEGIVMHLNRGYNLRIERIVLDFLRNDVGRLFFCGCKGFVLDKVTIPLAVHQVTNSMDSISVPDPNEIELRKQELEDRKKGSFVRCKLCRMHYSNLELAHSVSVRMLLLFKVHAAKRIDLPMDTSHLKVTTSDLLSQTVRVCPFCYVLVTSEFMLVNMEKDMAEAMNIPYKEEPLEEDTRHLMQMQFLPKAFIQWRLLIHFHSITGLKERESGLALFVRLHDYVSKFDLADHTAMEDVPLNRLKGMYFFANPKKSVRKFLSNFKAEFTIETDSRIVMRGVSPILTEFPSTLPMGSAITSKKHISVFNLKANSCCELVVTVGLSCDHLSESKYLKVALAKVLDVYIPEEHYCNADPFPLQWMEHFGEEPESHSFEEDESRNDYYMPSLTTEDVKRMQDISAPFPARLRELFQEPPHDPISAVVSATSVQKTVAKKSKDSTYMDFDGLETDISVRELFSTVKTYLGSRTAPAVDGVKKGIRRVFTANKSIENKERELTSVRSQESARFSRLTRETATSPTSQHATYSYRP